MTRITKKQLANLVRILNEDTGNPVDYFNAEKRIFNPGNYHLDIAYDGYRLCQVCNDAGGTSDITGRGTKQWLYDQIQTLRKGIRIGREMGKFTIKYKGVYVHGYIASGICRFYDLRTGKAIYCKSIKSAKNKITRMLGE